MYVFLFLRIWSSTPCRGTVRRSLTFTQEEQSERPQYNIAMSDGTPAEEDHSAMSDNSLCRSQHTITESDVPSVEEDHSPMSDSIIHDFTTDMGFTPSTEENMFER